MSDPIVVTLRGDPRGKGRPRHRIIIPKPGTASWSKGKRKPFTITYTDEETEAYEKALGLAGRVAMKSRPLLSGQLIIKVTAVFSVPVSWPRKKRDAALSGTLRPTGSPDWDNVGKTTDGLNGIVWVDDSKIVSATVDKFYGEEPYLRVEVSEVGLALFEKESSDAAA